MESSSLSAQPAALFFFFFKNLVIGIPQEMNDVTWPHLLDDTALLLWRNNPQRN